MSLKSGRSFCIRNIDMVATIKKAELKGRIKAIPSKSQAHRMLIAAAFADVPTFIACNKSSKDIDATADCLRAMGSAITYDEEKGGFYVEPVKKLSDSAVIDCGESGSTLRFLLPVICALGMECRIIMHGRLPERPLSPLWEELIKHGAVLKKNEDKTISVSGRIKTGEYEIAADVSSQFISGLIFAMPLLDEPFTVRLVGNIESADYIHMTIGALQKFGVNISWEGDKISLQDAVKYTSPKEVSVEGDWSNGAFWLAAGAILNGNVETEGLDIGSSQGDKEVVGLLSKIRAGDTVIDAKNVPDLVPILSVAASVSKGTTKFINAGRLRLKESDRIQSTVTMLKALGAKADETEDGLIVTGTGYLKGGRVYSFGDHRIAMSAAIAACASKGEVIIDGAEAVEKSYPGFWDDFEALGGIIEKSIKYGVNDKTNHRIGG